MEKIRLNEQKRRLLKKEWSHTVYNNMPMQVEEDLRLAQENFRSVRNDVWDNVITPQVLASLGLGIALLYLFKNR